MPGSRGGAVRALASGVQRSHQVHHHRLQVRPVSRFSSLHPACNFWPATSLPAVNRQLDTCSAAHVHNSIQQITARTILVVFPSLVCTNLKLSAKLCFCHFHLAPCTPYCHRHFLRPWFVFNRNATAFLTAKITTFSTRLFHCQFFASAYL